MAQEKDYNFLFGSGDLYIVPDSVNFEEDDEETIEAALVKIGESSGEASLSVAPEFYDVKGGATNQVLASFQISEEIKFNAGICTLDLKRMSDIVASTFTETEAKRIMKLGTGASVPVNRLRFVHTKKQDGKRLIIDMHKAMNKSGLTLTFNPESESVFDLEFTLMKAQNKDNIVTITEEI